MVIRAQLNTHIRGWSALD